MYWLKPMIEVRTMCLMKWVL